MLKLMLAAGLALALAAPAFADIDPYPIIVTPNYPDPELPPDVIRLDERDGRFIKYSTGRPHEGWAKVTLPSGVICQCSFKRGVPTDGTLIYTDGSIYDGELASYRPNGDGEIKFADGREYEGEFRRGVPNGEGRLRYVDGSSYRGTFKDGLPYRDISFLSGDLKTSYDGDFENGRPSYGTIAYIDEALGNTRMFGNFVSHGEDPFALLLTGEGGLFSFRNGEVHGNFTSTGLEGFGLGLYWDDGNAYAGPYRAGQRHGQVGSLILPRGVSSLLREGTRLRGKFENGKLVGEVTIIAKDGSKSEALVIDEQMVQFAKVDVFTGLFEDGELVEITSERTSAPNYFENPAAIIERGNKKYRLSPDSVAQLEYLTEKMREGEILKKAGLVAPWLKLWVDLPKSYNPSIIGMATDAGGKTLLLKFTKSEWDVYPDFINNIDNVVKARLRGIIQYNILHHQLTRGNDGQFWTDMMIDMQLGRPR